MLLADVGNATRRARVVLNMVIKKKKKILTKTESGREGGSEGGTEMKVIERESGWREC